MHKHQLIQILIDRYQYKSYLELGCLKDENFKAIRINNKTGVDHISGGSIRLTTQQFFDSNHSKFDIIFIDADHSYQGSKYDLLNSLDCLCKRGCIVLHDTLPIKPEDQNLSFNGQVWKTVVEMRSRQDLKIITVDIQYGCTIIFKVDANDDTIVVEEPTFEQYINNKRNWLNIVSPEELLSVLPEPDNPNDISVATVANWGRIGHQFADLISSRIIAAIFGLNHINLGWTGNHSALNYRLPYFSDSSSIKPSHRQTITINLNAELRNRINAVDLNYLREIISSIPPNTMLLFTNSTSYLFARLIYDENHHDILPGTIDTLRNQIASNLLPVVKTNESNIVNIAGFIRAGGQLRDLRHGFEASRMHNVQIINRIRSDFSGRDLSFTWYSQGPIADLDNMGYSIISKVSENQYIMDMADRFDHKLVICDDTYPLMADIIADMLSADIFITGYSSFSNLITFARLNNNYSSSLNPFKIARFENIIDINDNFFS